MNLAAKLAPFGLLSLLLGCSTETDTMKDPGSVPITAVDFDALYVVNGESGTISVIDATKNEVAGTIALRNISFPHHLNPSPDRTELALAVPGMDLSAGHGMSGHGMALGSVLVLDAATGKTLAGRRLDGPNHNAAFSPDGKEIWTSQMIMAGKVLVLDAVSLETKVSIEGGDMPAEVTFSKNGKYAFAANGMGNSVTVIDVASKSVVKTISVGADPVGAWPGSDGIMYVDNESGKSISAIDAATLEIVRTYNLGFMPGMAATSPAGELWVTDADNGKVIFFTAGDTTRIGDLTTGAGAHAITFNTDGKTAYISNQGTGTVTVIDVASRRVTKNIEVGSKPNGMVFKAKG